MTEFIVYLLQFSLTLASCILFVKFSVWFAKLLMEKGVIPQ